MIAALLEVGLAFTWGSLVIANLGESLTQKCPIVSSDTTSRQYHLLAALGLSALLKAPPNRRPSSKRAML